MSENVISEVEFIQVFRPIANHMSSNAPFNWGNRYGTMFETFGDELAFVRSQPEECVWTLIECDSKLLVVSGYRFVNRIGYFICQESVSKSECIWFDLDSG